MGGQVVVGILILIIFIIASMFVAGDLPFTPNPAFADSVDFNDARSFLTNRKEEEDITINLAIAEFSEIIDYPPLLEGRQSIMAYENRQKVDVVEAVKEVEGVKEKKEEINTDIMEVLNYESVESIDYSKDVEDVKFIYLTFDDGPNQVSTPKILAILDDFDIKATFFVIGYQIEKSPELLIEIVERGHYVGNHTYSHNYKKLYASANSFIEDITINEELIYSIIGIRPRVVRDPGGMLLGKYNSLIHKKLVELGYERMEWDIDSYDSRNPVPSKERLITNVKNQLNSLTKSEINILFHDSNRNRSTIEALPEIIEYLINEGYQFKIPH